MSSVQSGQGQERLEAGGNELIGGSDSEEEWTGAGFGGGLTGATEVGKRGLWLLRLRAAQKPCSHKD